MSERDVIVGMTGASGAIHGRAVVRELLAQGLTVHLIPTAHAEVVWQNEMDRPTPATAAKPHIAPAPDWPTRLNIPPGSLERLVVYDDGDIGSEPASGTFVARGMVVVPCSMNTLAKIAHGIADTLLTRAAGVCLKERRPLVLVTRETPLSLADLRNQVAAAEAGAIILPACPAFYHRPSEVSDLVHFVVSKICDQIGLPCEQPVRYDGAE